MHDFFKHFFGFPEKKIKIVALEKMTRKKQKKESISDTLFFDYSYFVKKAIGSINCA